MGSVPDPKIQSSSDIYITILYLG